MEDLSNNYGCASGWRVFAFKEKWASMIRVRVSGIEMEKIMDHLMPPQAYNAEVNKIRRHEIAGANIVFHGALIGGRHHDNSEV